jgi:hypothetical protein
MKINTLLPVLLFIFASVAKAQELPKPLKPVTKELWAEDIDYFAKRLVKKHANAFHFTTEENFNKAIADLKKDLPGLQDHQVVVRLMQITSSIGDGHTNVHMPGGISYYPISLFWFGKEVYVTRATVEYKQLAGKKLVKINGHSTDEINRKLSSLITTNENDWFAMNVSGQMMGVPEILHTIGIVSSVEKAKFTFADAEGKETEIELQPFVPDGKKQWVSAVKEEPLFRQRLNEKFWFTYLEDINAVYVNFKSYDDLGKNASQLFDFIQEKNATKLIVDLRQNGGGDFKKGRRQLISRIQENTILNQKDHLFVITGRRTFSAAMVNAIDFKNMTNATIIGEPPGEKPNSYSENDEMTLPNSGLVISYSTKYYKFLDKDVPAFEPDVRVDPNWKDFAAGVDPALQKTKTIILQKKAF